MEYQTLLFKGPIFQKKSGLPILGYSFAAVPSGLQGKEATGSFCYKMMKAQIPLQQSPRELYIERKVIILQCREKLGLKRFFMSCFTVWARLECSPIMAVWLVVIKSESMATTQKSLVNPFLAGSN